MIEQIMSDAELLTEYLWLSLWLSLIIAWLLMSFRIVPQGMHYTVECCGWHLRTLKPGLHVVIPFVERIAKHVNVKQTSLQIPTQHIMTRDAHLLTLTGTVAFQIVHAGRAAYKVNNLSEALFNLALMSMRITASQIELRSWDTEQAHYNALLQARIASFAKEWGVEILWVESERLLASPVMANNGVNSAK